jgi:hypothetical protein
MEQAKMNIKVRCSTQRTRTSARTSLTPSRLQRIVTGMVRGDAYLLSPLSELSELPGIPQICLSVFWALRPSHSSLKNLNWVISRNVTCHDTISTP